MDLLYHPLGGGADRHRGEQAVVGQLGLAEGQLGLGDGGLGVFAVQLIEQSPLLNPVPHLKGGLKNGAAGQSADLIGFNGVTVPDPPTETVRS